MRRWARWGCGNPAHRPAVLGEALEMIVGLGIGIILAICGCGIMAWVARPPGTADPPGGKHKPDPVQPRPALVNFVLTKCSPGTAAYHATILDLAGQGFLAVR